MIPVDPEDFATAVTRRLTLDVPSLMPETPRPNGDHLLDPGDHAMEDGPPAKPAAVLIPIVAHRSPTVILTQRTSHLASHAGQIAFPGGKIDPEDSTPADAALREAEEEIGLDRAHVRPLGYLAPFLSRTGYHIVPLVGLVAPGSPLTINPREVTEAFEVPLGFLMDPANHQRHEREWQGRMRAFYAMPYGNRYIWGITAGILRNLYERLSEPVSAARGGD